MNIFVLDYDIGNCARFHCDQHVVKMILESAQLLCTALNQKGFSTPYKPTHTKHPCVLWLEESYDNFLWLEALVAELNREYRFRYGHINDHASMKVVNEIKPHRYEAIGLTPFAQAMPDQYKVAGNAAQAYRAFYNGEKLGFAKWTKREIPYWVIRSRRAAA